MSGGRQETKRVKVAGRRVMEIGRRVMVVGWKSWWQESQGGR